MSPAIASWRDVLCLLGRKPTNSDIRAFQRKRLHTLVRFAATTVPFYQSLFKTSGVQVDTIKGLEDLHQIPQISKWQLRGTAEADRVARDVITDRLVSHVTSGSTGQPVTIRRTTSEEIILGLLRERTEHLTGKRAFDLVAVLSESTFHSPRMLVGRVAASLGLFRQLKVPIREDRGQIAASLARIAPDVIGGYPNSMRNVSVAAETLDEFPPPRMILAGGEMIPPDTRAQIEKGFGAPLYESYAAHEFNLLAWQCPHDTGLLHTCDEGAIVEVLENGEPVCEGEQGDVVATALHSYAMPFIRYRTGDRAVRGPTPCPCGWPTGTLRSIDGRLSDYFLLPNNRWLHPISIVGPMLVDEIGWVDRHQLIQEQEDRITMRLTILRPPPPGRLERIKAQAHRTLGSDVDFEIEFVDRIEAEPGSKFMSYISRSAPRDHRNAG